MPSNPSFQFYPADYSRDTAMLSAAARGVWMDTINALHWAKPRGKMTMDLAGLDRLWRTKRRETLSLLKELKESQVCEIVTDANNRIKIMSRRMTKEEKAKESNRLRQSNYRVTHKSQENNIPSSSSSSSSKTNTNPSLSPLNGQPEEKADYNLTPEEVKENLRKLKEIVGGVADANPNEM